MVTVSSVWFTTTSSGRPSPSRSPIATAVGFAAVLYSFGEPNVPLPLPRTTATAFAVCPAIMRSRRPSPLTSPVAIAQG